MALVMWVVLAVAVLLMGLSSGADALEARRRIQDRKHRVRCKAEAVFEDSAAADSWLHAQNLALGGVSPLTLLDTDEGEETVVALLHRIEHGVLH